MNKPVRMVNPTVTATLWYHLCPAHLPNTDPISPMTDIEAPITNNAVKEFTRNSCCGIMRCKISLYEIAANSTTQPKHNTNSDNHVIKGSILPIMCLCL